MRPRSGIGRLIAQAQDLAAQADAGALQLVAPVAAAGIAGLPDAEWEPKSVGLLNLTELSAFRVGAGDATGWTAPITGGSGVSVGDLYTTY